MILRGLVPKSVHLCYLLTMERMRYLITVQSDKEYLMLTLVGNADKLPMITASPSPLSALS